MNSVQSRLLAATDAVRCASFPLPRRLRRPPPRLSTLRTTPTPPKARTAFPPTTPTCGLSHLSGEGFTSVACFTEFGSAPTYESTEAPDPGTDWLIIVLASDDGGIFDIIGKLQVGQVFSLEDENGSQATLSAAVLPGGSRHEWRGR